MVLGIPGFDNYLITDRGEIYSIRRQGHKGGIVHPSKTGTGYLRISLRNEEGKKTFYLHRLVAEVFIANPENKPCVNHIDGDKSNNSVKNLEWCSYSENMKHAIAHGLNSVPALSGENHPNSKLTWADVRTIRKLFAAGASSTEIGRRFGVCRDQIYNIVLNKQWREL